MRSAEITVSILNSGHDEEEALANSIATSLKRPKPLAIALPHLSIEVLAYEYASLYRQVLEKRLAKAAAQSDLSKVRDNSALREV